MKRYLVSLCVPCLAVSAFAQSGTSANGGANPLSSGQKGYFGMMKNYVLKAADEMPESSYSFKPVDTVRSFGQLVAHIADAQYEFCSPVLGDTTEHASVEKSATTKADIVAGLKTAFAYCDKAYDGLTDDHAADRVKFFGREAAKLTVLSINNAHTDEHYGNMVTYLRMKGMVPPSSKQ